MAEERIDHPHPLVVKIMNEVADTSFI